MTLTVGMAGIGAIGGVVMRARDPRDILGFELGGIAARDSEKIMALSAERSAPPQVLDFCGPARHRDWVVETLPPALFDNRAWPVLSAGRVLVVLSASQLLSRDDLVALVRERGGRIVVPSGAMLGLDALKAVKVAKVESVIIETRKPTEGLMKSDYVIRTGMDLDGVTEATCILAGGGCGGRSGVSSQYECGRIPWSRGDRSRPHLDEDMGRSDSARNKHVVRVLSDKSAQRGEPGNGADHPAERHRRASEPVSMVPRIKWRNTVAYGAQVMIYDRQTGDRAEIAKDLSEKIGAVSVPPYDDHLLMAGQGTVSCETARQLQDLGIRTDALICPVGGRLIAGAATDMNALSPQTRLYVAEPEHFDDTRLFYEQGERVASRPGSILICDAIVTTIPEELTFPINQALLSSGFTVAEKRVLRAMKAAQDRRRARRGGCPRGRFG